MYFTRATAVLGKQTIFGMHTIICYANHHAMDFVGCGLDGCKIKFHFLYFVCGGEMTFNRINVGSTFVRVPAAK